MKDFTSEQQNRYFELLDEVDITCMKKSDSSLSLNNKQQGKKKGVKIAFFTSGALACSLVLLIVLSSIFPSFAHAMSNIPLLKPIMQLLNLDKGIVYIIENEYYEPLHITKKEEQLEITLLGVIADESGMILSLEIKSEDELSQFSGLTGTLFRDDEPIVGLTISNHLHQLEQPTYLYYDMVEVRSHKTIDYSNPSFTLLLESSPSNTKSIFKPMSIEIPFTLMKPVAHSKHISINEDITVDGQKINIQSIKVSPIRTEVNIAFDESNTMNILDLSKTVLIDDQGGNWSSIGNGVNQFTTLDDGSHLLTFESSYFRMPERLTINFSSIMAIPKDEANVRVDFETKEVLYQPSSINTIVEVINDNTVRNEYKEDLHQYESPLGRLTDANGEVFYVNKFWYEEEDGKQYFNLSYGINDNVDQIVSPATIEIVYVEHYLQGEASIEVNINE